MKTLINIKLLLVVFTLTAIFSACEDEVWPDAPRLFRPVASEDIIASGNSLLAQWTPVADAVNYTIELSADSFLTVLNSITIEETAYLFDSLEWDVLYQIQVKANAADADESSRFSMLGSKKTEKFPSIMAPIGAFDVIDKAVKISWTDKADPATKVTFEVEGQVVKEVMFTVDDQTAATKEIFGLTPSTTYKISIWSGDDAVGYTLQGYETFTTKPAIESDIIVDLRDSLTPPTLSADFFATVPTGAVLLLKGGEVYNMNGALAGDITIMTGYSFTGRATLRSTGAFNAVLDATYGQIILRDVNIIGDDNGFGGRYVFNINVASTIGEIKIEDCSIYALRGVVRTQSGPQIQKVTIDNCVIDSINGYGVINCDNAGSSIVEMSVTNSTLQYIQKILVNSKSITTTSINFSNNTVCWAPLGNNFVFDMNGQTANVVMDNNIFGPAWEKPGTPPIVLTKGYRGNLTFGSGANFLTADYLADEGSALPSTEVITSTSSQLWESPENRLFYIVDSKFAGKDTAGDPRWR